MNTKIFLASAIIASAALSSCSDKPTDDEIVEQNLVGYVNIITDTNTGDKSVADGLSYALRYNYSALTGAVTISGLTLPDGTAFPKLTTDVLRWSADADSWKNMSAASVLTSAVNFGNTPVLNNFVFNVQDIWVDDAYSAMTVIRYDIDQYHIVSIPRTVPCFGHTVVTGPSGFVFDTDETVYVVEVDAENNTAALSINNFAIEDGQRMTAVAITGIPLVIDNEGNLAMTAESAVATVVGAPDPALTRMPVSGLSATLRNGVFTISYNISVDGSAYSIKVQ